MPGLVALIGFISVATLAAAWSFQYGGGLVPCELCMLGRWPHYLLAALGILGGLWLRKRPAFALARILLALALLIALGGVGIGAYHTGVERGWWQGPTGCTVSADTNELSTADLLAAIDAAPTVLCNEVQWTFLTLSMATWNAAILLLQAGLAGLSLLLLMRRARAAA